MKTRTQAPAAILLMAAPVAAYAQGGAPHILFSFGGGFLGGLIGALLACWLCNRRRNRNDRTDVKKY